MRFAYQAHEDGVASLDKASRVKDTLSQQLSVIHRQSAQPSWAWWSKNFAANDNLIGVGSRRIIGEVTLMHFRLITYQRHTQAPAAHQTVRTATRTIPIFGPGGGSCPVSPRRNFTKACCIEVNRKTSVAVAIGGDKIMHTIA
ncbi:hypothetical protein ACNKHW_20085 [Shigella flexneri]